jgi:hypothetical protein
MKRLLTLALLLGLTAAAHAQTTIISGPRGTVHIFSPRPRPQQPMFAPDLRTPAEIAARTEAWEARCRPTLSAPDKLGVQRYVYAAPGCEFGD